ncbi:Serine carboxypeptidase S28, putative [Angomonas deanei]|uniref:Serine carboxypeptidase S28, putative n=1 Tax=Angomonas deanei TaxID=59799 RepID=A0A7G2C6R8_9TRYP|nr:Serine carboxypeptidase S28, putative [Angomonas deanei]
MNIPYRLFALLLVLQTVLTTQALVDLLPERARGGLFYQEALKSSQPYAGTPGTATTPRMAPNTTVNYFEQYIDHNATDRGTFRQRWWMDKGGWDGVRPRVMLYIHGESAASSTPTGFAQQYAYESHSLLLALEHRFYGESLVGPLTDRSLLKYLSVENAMADLKHFRDTMTAHFFPQLASHEVDWYVVGGSYPGALAVWLKETYPDRFKAAWSSSGVVQSIFDFYQFDYHLLKVLPLSCSTALRTLFQHFSSQYEVEEDSVRQALQVPAYFTKEDMAWMLVDGAAMAVQYGKKGLLCSNVVQSDGVSPVSLSEYATLLRLWWGSDFTSSCYYSTTCLSDPAYSSQWGASYAWVYQCCSQLAYWQVGYPNSLRLELLNSSYFIYQCRSAYGEEVFPDTYQFNARYGGAYPHTDHVVALQGSDDPWVPAGAADRLDPQYPVSVATCDGCGHCGDLHTPSSSDHPSLVAQRALIKKYLDTWLGVEHEQ